MTPYFADERAVLIRGEALDALRAMPDDSVDAIVTDPPYEIGFMAKGWDKTGIAFSVDLWREALRVLKPGGHLLSFGGTRTYHRMTCAIEDAGFEIRDSIHWVYLNGFIKSMNVSKAIDASLGAERTAIPGPNDNGCMYLSRGEKCPGHGEEDSQSGATIHVQATAPGSPEAARWEGWGTALKPSHEPVVLARKPLDGTVIASVLAHGTGALNLGACMVSGVDEKDRLPANSIFDEGALTLMPEKAASVFYCPKPSKKETELGCEHLPLRTAGEVTDRKEGSAGLNSPRAGAGRTSGAKNHHPSKKPVDLMRYLCRLVTPPGGLVLDCFCGSGSTGVAALAEGFSFVGVERDLDDETGEPLGYCEIIKARLIRALADYDKESAK